MEVSVKLYHDTRRALKNSQKFPVKLSVSYQRKTKFYSSGIALTVDEYEKMIQAKYLTGQLLMDSNKIIALKKEFESAREFTKPFSFDRFEKNLNPANRKTVSDMYSMFEQKFSEMEKEGKVSNLLSYKTTLNHLKNFTGKQKLPFIDVSIDFLKEWERYLTQNNCTIGTIGVYMRNLRHLFNRGIEAKLIDAQLYPFGVKGYRIKAPGRTKKALNKEDAARIVDYWKTATGNEKIALDYWVFSLTSNGINMKDILEMRWRQYHNDTIEVMRAKTRNTNVNQSPIIIHLTEINQDIIARLSPTFESRNPNEYIFPELSPDMNDSQLYHKIRDRRKFVNRHMKLIGQKLNIPDHIRFETARHTFANILKYSNVSSSMLSDFFGHSSPNTIKNYLGSIVSSEERKVIVAYVSELAVKS